MQKIFEAMNRDNALAKALSVFASAGRQSVVYGMTGAQKSFVIAAAFRNSPRPAVIISGSAESAGSLKSDLAVLLPDIPVIELPAVDLVTFTATAKSMDLAARRMDALGRLIRGETAIVLATAEAAVQKVLPKQEFINNRTTVETGKIIVRDEFIHTMVRFGYERVEQIDAMGQFSVRGGVIDIYPINRELPVRMELFGDEIDSLREFDPVTQRSSGSISRADILPVAEPEHTGAMTTFFSYLPDNAVVIFDEPTRIRENINKVIKENPALKKRVFGWQELAAGAKDYNIVYLSLMLQKTPHTEPTEIISVTAKGVAPFHRQIDLLVDDLKTWLHNKFFPIIFLPTAEKASLLQRSLSDEGIDAVFSETIGSLSPGLVHITIGAIAGGFELPHAKLVILTELDIFGRQKKARRPRVAKDKHITYFRDIKVGDYVVHVNHGIGKYVGVETLEVAGSHKDYLLIRYAGEDKLYVPTDQVHLLQKYIGGEGEVPRLHRMGGSDWVKAKAKAKAAASDLARELIALYAERQITPGIAFDPDTPWQREFEDAFPFVETPDQLAAIKEIKRDMERPQPMDRLLCGDVGFGKTEVAIRAAFKAVMSGKQVAVLVPTTVLAQQHYQTFSSRFAGFGPVVDVISRFRSAKEQRETLSKLADGRVDVLIGTHRILNPDVVFKDLGLLIVDEEQRFGVQQKERLKKWRANIDVLTLSATPIPRTLHMSLVGARDMSIIETPPEDRFPVQTYVVEYHDEIIREAIKRELKRGGQVYFVYNQVETIDKMHYYLSTMLPDAKIQTAHGQMAEEILEQVMLDFYEGEFDILICTSIIENGLDVPNANTIIIYDADRFGLSQLYQMRGRVGRSHRMAYAYLTYRRDKVLSEVAEKRLQAIKEFTELGAGFKIAMRDLEIRGAGNLLGPQQHGHITSVGFEMYCRLLDEAVQEAKTGTVVEPPPEPVLELKVDAYLTGDYISDPMHKIEIYQKIAAIRNEEHVKDLTDELIDRFGELPPEVTNLLDVARVKNAARQLGAKAVIEHQDYVEIQFGGSPKVDVASLMALKTSQPGRIKIIPGPPEVVRLKTARLMEPKLGWLSKTMAAMAVKSDEHQ